MARFAEEYKRLNLLQQQAVNTIEGPVLVVAGPGTGKTQLLSLRVANIMHQTDTAPANILCLTFTDNAARNMRERLETIIGQAAYHVNIHTFHSFGVELINQYPDFFIDRQLIQQIDELGSYELLRSIFEELPHTDPLSIKVGDEYIMLKDTLSIIGWLKQNALTPSEFGQVIAANQKCMKALSSELSKVFEGSPSPKNLPVYTRFLELVQSKITDKLLFGFPDYATVCASELIEAVDSTNANSRFAPQITKWRNKWCEKNAEGKWAFKDDNRSIRKLHAVARVYDELLARMHRQGLYDFDDMIVEAVHALEKYDELRANVQERYMYVLVDEFQDTNKAQLRILEALGNNPIYENRPNIMAVGDDDQAIYTFQGAEVSNMVAFTKLFDQPALITLIDNYRSTKTILEISQAVASQITDRLETIFPQASKQLVAQGLQEDKIISYSVLPSELAQYQWIAEEINKMIQRGMKPEEIAIIAPRHKYLERLMPYLGQFRLPVAYERRENVLEAPIIKQLVTMAKLIVAINENRQADVDALLSEVISYAFWNIPTDVLLKLSIQCYDKHTHWLPALLSHNNKELSRIAGWLLGLARRSSTEPLEYVLDAFMGIVPEDIDADETPKNRHGKPTQFYSPMRQHYFSESSYEATTDAYLALLGQLSTLRQRLRQWKPDHTLYIHDLVDFAELNYEAHLKIIDTNPHTQTTNAVQVMTAYKAKGLEFSAVFIINAQDEVWGPTSRSRSMRISLPKNLPLEPRSNGDNDRLRLLFVALSRAKNTLLVTGYTHTLENKLSPSLSFIGGNMLDSAAIHPKLKPQTIDKPASVKAVEILTTDWLYRFRHIIADKPTLLAPILAKYKLSVTHLNNFIDVIDGGPQYFLTHNLLRFPQALTPSAAYGDAIHKTLQWIHSESRDTQTLPTIIKIQAHFTDMLSRLHLRTNDFKRLEARGKEALALYVKERRQTFLDRSLIERGFNNEGVVINNAQLSGKIDKIYFSEPAKVSVIDFKTGKPAISWKGKDEYEKVKLHKYRQQLLFYKLLVEHSATFQSKLKVTGGGLEFIETNEQGKLVDNLDLDFEVTELERFGNLIGAVWKHIQTLNLPDVNTYDKSLKGITQFEDDLIRDKI